MGLSVRALLSKRGRKGLLLQMNSMLTFLGNATITKTDFA